MNIKQSKFVTTAALVAMLFMAGSASADRPSVSIPVTQLRYSETGVTDGTHGQLQAGPAYGDLSHGAHGTFIKMPPGFVSPVHTHTEDYYGVVISGVAVNGLPGSRDTALPVGSYWFQRGGELHVTKCISPNECIFFISQPGKFDYVTQTAKK